MSERVYKAVMASVDESLGLVFGVAIVSTIEGVPYYDTQGDYIPDDVMLEGALDFSKNRSSDVMHDDVHVGSVVFMWPLTEEVKKAYGIESAFSGLLVAVQPETSEVLAKYKSGELKGFSIAGTGYYGG